MWTLRGVWRVCGCVEAQEMDSKNNTIFTVRNRRMWKKRTEILSGTVDWKQLSLASFFEGGSTLIASIRCAFI